MGAWDGGGGSGAVAWLGGFRGGNGGSVTGSVTAVLSGGRKNGLLFGNGTSSNVAPFRDVDLVTEGGREVRLIAGAEYVGDRRPPSLLSSSAPAAE